MSFTTVPRCEDMVTQDCVRPNSVDLLCVACGWEGHCEPQAAPWPVFQTHKCKLRTERVAKDF